ncbi:MAG: Zn-dependent hydrolase [Balneola sp.]
MKTLKIIAVLMLTVTISCAPKQNNDEMDELLSKYTEFTLTTDLGQLSENEKKMIPLLIEAGKEMNKVFWLQAYGEKGDVYASLSEKEKEFFNINYGPWDRLDGNEPFIEGTDAKPAGANFYPSDMTKEEFEAWESEDKASLYTLVRRGESGELMTIPYNEAFEEYHQKAAMKLREAAEFADDKGLKNYLMLRADALESNEYQESDLAWMDMRDNGIDIVIGPIENYEDQLYGYKAANEAFVLVKDKSWSERLSKYTAVLPELQKGLPVDAQYKKETPGNDSQLNAYDVIYYAGDSNAGSKTIAINLPNDEEVQLKKGTRRLQLKNAMQAKYDKILVPISGVLIDESQRQYVSFESFFGNTMFHEVAHGLGIKNTITGNGTVREALQNHASALEEGKADVLGLYMVKSLRAQEGMITTGSIENDYVTFLASIFRSIRFGSSSAHGRANLIRFNFFQEMGAFTYNEETETYAINFDKVEAAVDALSEKILTLQGNGDYEAVDAFVTKYAVRTPQLEASLEKLSEQNIPVDIIFNQGVEVLGL